MIKVRDMLTARYYLAWEKPNGDEIYCKGVVGESLTISRISTDRKPNHDYSVYSSMKYLLLERV